MNWQTIDTAPQDGTHILIRYYKGNKSKRTNVENKYIVAEAYLGESHRIYCGTDALGTQTWKATYGWFDALKILILNTSSKNPKNFVTHWMPLPSEPEE